MKITGKVTDMKIETSPGVVTITVRLDGGDMMVIPLKAEFYEANREHFQVGAVVSLEGGNPTYEWKRMPVIPG